MVVADEDPPRKRSKLSLKSSRKGESTPPLDEPPSLEPAGAAPQGPVIRPKSEPTAEDCPPPVLDLSQSDLPCDSCGVPPVASLENLGNTCFLNSVLEVLRYTPCFLEGLGELYRHIIYLEKVKAAASSKSGSETKTEPNLSWELVKNIYKTYKMMEKKEQMFHQLASVDVTSMSVKPNKILDDIRYFNPMFEGNMQHDAQEFLRCLLCYLEDAEKELHDAYTGILAMDPSLLKIPPVCEKDRLTRQNNIMEKFLEKGRGRWSRSSATGVKQEECVVNTSPAVSGPDFAGDARQFPLLNQQDDVNWESVNKGSSKGHVSTRWSNKAETETKILPSKRSVDEAGGKESARSMKSVMENVWNAKELANCSKRQKVGEEKSTSAEEALSQKEVQGSNSMSSSGHIPTEKKIECAAHKDNNAAKSGPGLERIRRSSRQTLTNMRAKCRGNTCNASSSKSSKENCGMTVTDDSWPEGSRLTNAVHGDKKYQPTIQSMFEKKRLGMRGGVSCKGFSGGQSECRNKKNANQEPPSDGVTMSFQKENCNNSDMISTHSCKQEVEPEMCSSEAGDAEIAVTSTSDKRKCRAGLSSQINSPVTGSKIISKSPPPNNMQSVLVTRSELEKPAAAYGAKEEEKIKVKDEDRQQPGTWETVCTNSQCGPASSSHTNTAVVFQSGILRSDTSRRRPEKLDKTLESPSGKTKMNSPAAGVAGVKEKKVMTILQPGKLMIKLEKCDHVCNSPSISASAALKALQTPSCACRRVDFDKNQSNIATDGADSDHEEEELSLGTMGSFKSVPLKSVCIKVEKCDMVCNSPDKSVNAQFAATCLARRRAQRFNIIEKLFQGTMMMRTKCLECERCTERKESFQDISVPLKRERSNEVDSDSDEERDSSLLSLMNAFTDVEHLRDDNKYFCDRCLRYVEAQRSLHYEALQCNNRDVWMSVKNKRPRHGAIATVLFALQVSQALFTARSQVHSVCNHNACWFNHNLWPLLVLHQSASKCGWTPTGL